MKKQLVWILWGRTESGDDVGPYVWSKKPKAEWVLSWLYDNHFDDLDGGKVTEDDIALGHIGAGYLSLSLESREVIA